MKTLTQHDLCDIINRIKHFTDVITRKLCEKTASVSCYSMLSPSTLTIKKKVDCNRCNQMRWSRSSKRSNTCIEIKGISCFYILRTTE